MSPLGPFGRLPRPPRSIGGKLDPFELSKWYDRIWQLLSSTAGIAWEIVSKVGSSLADIEDRLHSHLQGVEQADDTSSNATGGKHVTDALVKKYEDHRLIIDGNPHGTDHSMLDAIAQADDTSSDATGGKHVTNAQVKKYEDHRLIVDDNPHGTDHSQLDAVLQADVDLTDTNVGKHITNALAYSWDRNECYAVSVSTDAIAEPGQHISVTCSTVDITITLPSAANNAGMPIWIHKTDATAYRVLTSVKDIAFQNSTMHLISNGTDWVIS